MNQTLLRCAVLLKPEPHSPLHVLHPCTAPVLQETLRTTTFPTEHVKDKWEANMYISGIAFGRTVS